MWKSNGFFKIQKCLFQVLLAFFLFFGYIRLALDYDEYVSVLSLLGCLAGGHFFACLVVFQVRFFFEKARV